VQSTTAAGKALTRQQETQSSSAYMTVEGFRITKEPFPSHAQLFCYKVQKEDTAEQQTEQSPETKN